MNLLVTMLPTCKVYLNEDDDDDDVDIEEQAHSAHYPPLRACGTVHCLSPPCRGAGAPNPDPNPDPNPNPNPRQVHEASTFLVVLTTQYLTSRKCMLGLLTAWRLRKPIVVLREADVRYGGL